MKLKHNGEHVFRTQRITQNFEPIKPQQKEDNDVNNAATKVINRLAAGILARAKDESGIRVQVAPPPACILARTKAREMIDAHYAQPGTVKTNVNDIKGMESYEPPPCILAPLED